MNHGGKLFLYVSSPDGIQRVECLLEDIIAIYLASAGVGRFPYATFRYELIEQDSDLADPERKSPASETPANLQPEISRVRILAPAGDTCVHDQLYEIADVVGQTLKSAMASKLALKTVSLIGYSFKPLELFLKVAKPKVGGEFSLPKGRKRPPAFHVQAVPEDELATASFGDWGLAGKTLTEDDLPVTIFLRPEVAEELGQSMPMSSHWEEGGFLLGRAFRRSGTDSQYIVDVTKALPAKHTGASPTRLFFTADSFAELKSQIAANFPDTQILGWYHSHLFPATDEFGLSSADIDLHKSTYKRPWQVAGLVNFENDGHRKLRFYGIDSGRLVECPMRVAEIWPEENQISSGD